MQNNKLQHWQNYVAQNQSFKSELTKYLISDENGGRWRRELDVDYHPNKKLSDACHYAGIDTGALPCKTFTFINQENEVEGRYQYGGEFFKL